MTTAWGRFAFGLLFATLSNFASAHGEHGPVDRNIRVENPIEAVGTPYGRMGSSREISRTVEIEMSKDRHISPPSISIKKGETIRFLIRNSSSELHAFLLGTTDDVSSRLTEIQAGGLTVEDGMSSRRVAPGRTVEFVWEFTIAGLFEMVCLAPGHAADGMRGKISVE